MKEAFGGISDTKIAGRLNVSKAAVSLWKSGGGLSDSILIRAAELTQRPLEWLITGDRKYLAKEVAGFPHLTFPEQRMLAQILDGEFKRVAKLEKKDMAELIGEIATEVGLEERALYNFRSGKWPLPAALVPRLCKRFGSTALLKPLV